MIFSLGLPLIYEAGLLIIRVFVLSLLHGVSGCGVVSPALAEYVAEIDIEGIVIALGITHGHIAGSQRSMGSQKQAAA